MQAGLRHTGSALRPLIRACSRSPTTAGIGLRLCSNGTSKHNLARHFSSTSPKPNVAAAAAVSEDIQLTEDKYVYNGPLTTPFRNLKIFSLASIGLSISLTPILFVVESGLPMSARFALAGIALGTSGLSTGLVAYCAKPYVTTMRRFRPNISGSAEEIELTTRSIFLKPRITKVYDPSFLIETRRPLAKWELASKIHLTANRRETVGSNVHPEVGLEETVAETRDEKGDILGRWIVKWEADGVGKCHEMGHVVRYFNVHQELLQ